jgi:hypothetical protein
MGISRPGITVVVLMFATAGVTFSAACAKARERALAMATGSFCAQARDPATLRLSHRTTSARRLMGVVLLWVAHRRVADATRT